MHIKAWCAALGGLALFHGASATITVESTYTSTKTVVRVMEPTSATWSSSKAGPTGFAHSTGGWNSANGTAAATGTHGATWSASQSAPAMQTTTGAAALLSVDTLGMAAVAGIVGLVAL